MSIQIFKVYSSTGQNRTTAIIRQNCFYKAIIQDFTMVQNIGWNTKWQLFN